MNRLAILSLDAWIDAKHFLATPVSDFGFSDQALGNVTNLVAEMFRGDPLRLSQVGVPGRTAQADLHFSVAPRTTSIVEAMTAIVRAHGSLVWTVGYCRPMRKPEYASFMFWTFDRGGAGGGPKRVPDRNGKMHTDCPRAFEHR